MRPRRPRRFALPIPYSKLALQDCVDLAVFLIRTTAAAQRFTLDARDVGGPIDIAAVTRDAGMRFLQCKHLAVEPEAAQVAA